MKTTDGAHKARRKLIEVAITLEVINEHSQRDKKPRVGHPSTLHTWWARRPLPACRALVFASMVDDPSSCPEEFPTVEEQDAERKRLLKLMAELMVWENTDQRTPQGQKTIDSARLEIAKSLARSRGEKPPETPKGVLEYLSGDADAPTIFDPFAGGGSIPLEAQRLGLKAIASDLNPLAVLINRAMMEMPVEFQNRPPVSRGASAGRRGAAWRGYAGLAEDIQHYAAWVKEKAFERVGHLYPKARMPDGTLATVNAWIWANTVPCHNPACEFDLPLVKQFRLSRKPGRTFYVKPTVDRDAVRIRFSIIDDEADFDDVPTVDRNGATCLACGTNAPLSYVRDQAKRGSMSQQLMAIVAQGESGKLYLEPDPEHEFVAKNGEAEWRPVGSLPAKARSISTQAYGFDQWHHHFTERQLACHAAFVDAVKSSRRKIIDDGASERYADLIVTFLGLAFGKLLNSSSRLARWDVWSEGVWRVFSQQSIGMVWDFAELNPFSDAAKNWIGQAKSVAKAVPRLPLDVRPVKAVQLNATDSTSRIRNGGLVILTDPPYYDNIGYADISDYFYVWLREALGDIHPDLFVGIQTPKKEEIVKGPMFEDADARFERLLQTAFGNLRDQCGVDFPVTMFYAYKQKSSDGNGVASSGWERFLSALSKSGFKIVATWPMRTESPGKITAKKVGMLATSVAVVMRPRDPDAPTSTRREFIAELERTLPDAIELLIETGIGPADLEQAAIGPGMEVFTKYSRVETIGGDPVTVGEALREINRVLDEYYLGEEANLDSGTRFCRSWLDQFDFDAGPYGVAEASALARDVSINDLRDNARLIDARGGTVRLLTPDEITLDLTRPEPSIDTTAWEGCMRMVYHMEGGEKRRGIEGAAEFVSAIGREKADQVRSLAGILFNHYDRKFKPSKSRVYNDIVNLWPDIMDAAFDDGRSQSSFAA